MFTILKKKNLYFGDEKLLIQAVCTSEDTKPTEDITNGSLVLEMDTGKIYAFDEEGTEWIEQ